MLPILASWGCVSNPPEAPSSFAPADSGFVARAQRSDLIVVGRVRSISVGLLGGCDNTFAVEAVVKGNLIGETLRLHRSFYTPGAYCLSADSPGRWVLAVNESGESRLPDLDVPPGTSWRLVLDDDDWAYGEILRCYGITVLDQGVATNQPETTSLSTLRSLISGPTVPLCAPPRGDPGDRRRTIAGTVLNPSGTLRRARLSLGTLVPDADPIAITKTANGRFTFEGVPGDWVRVRSEDGAFDPFLVPPEVTDLRVVSPWYGRPEPPDLWDYQEISDLCDQRCGEDGPCAADCYEMVKQGENRSCQACLMDSYPSLHENEKAVRKRCAEPCVFLRAYFGPRN